MLQSLYNYFGLFGAIGVAFILFLLFIIWFAGVSGITLPVDGGRKRGSTSQTIFAIIFPPFPIIWMIARMIEQISFFNKKGNRLKL